MSGNGIRAARREKELSRPLGDGKSPPKRHICMTSGVLMRRHAHHVERRVLRDQFMIIDFNDFLKPEPPAVSMAFLWDHVPGGTDLRPLIHGRASVHVTEKQVYF